MEQQLTLWLPIVRPGFSPLVVPGAGAWNGLYSTGQTERPQKRLELYQRQGSWISCCILYYFNEKENGLIFKLAKCSNRKKNNMKTNVNKLGIRSQGPLVSRTFLGFLVISQTTYGDELGDSEIRFAQRRAHHDTKQPILVVYTNDGRQRTPHYISPDDQGLYWFSFLSFY